VGLKLNGTHQLVAYPDNMNLLEDDTDTDTIKKTTGALFDTSKEDGLEAEPEKTKFMLLARHQNAGQIHDIKTVKSFENVLGFQCLITTITNPKDVTESAKS
jgi:hypothetical protein